MRTAGPPYGLKRSRLPSAALPLASSGRRILIATGRSSGTLTLTTALGKLTLRVSGPSQFGQVPVPAVIFLVFAVVAHIVLRYTRYGRQVYAVGGNPEAARLSGLNVRAVTTSVYVIMGFFAGLGAFVLSARLNSAEAVAGTGYELTVIASVVIGGTSLFGGVTHVIHGFVDEDSNFFHLPR